MRSVPRAIPVLIFVTAFATLTVGFSFGPPAGFSGAPGEATCVLCHSSYVLNSGPDVLSITGPDHLAGGPSAALQVGWGTTLTPPQRRGFQITMRSAAGQPVGSWTLLDPNATQLNGPNHVNHTLFGINQQSWTVQWDLPAAMPAGPATFYAAGNYSNGNGAPTDDYIHTAKFTTYQAGLSAPGAAWTIGTTEVLDLNAPTVPGHSYVLAVSDGLVPTPLVGPFVVPLDITSPLTAFAWQLPQVFQNFIGSLDSYGTAQAAVVIPNEPLLAGFTVHFAFGTLDPASSTISEISNRVSRTLQ